MNKKNTQKKRVLGIVLLALLLSAAGMGKNFAQTSFTAGDLNYTINDDGTTVTLTGHVDGTSATGSLIIPESVSFEGSQYAVTRIKNFSFSNSDGLTGDLTIPNSVREIGFYAFSFCTGLNGRLTLGNSLTYIDVGAFNGCNFSGELILPESLTHIGPEAFGCRNISGVLHIPSSLKNISEDAFYLCKFDAIEVDAENPWYKSQDGVLFTSGIDTLVLYPIGSQATTYYVPNSVKRIGSSAFYACENLLSVSFPNSLEVIGSSAFNGCWGITSFSIPESVVSVGRSSFQQTSWWFNQNTDIVYLDGWCFGPKEYGGLSGALVIEDGTRGIASMAFYSTEITSLTLPNSLNYIDRSAFSNCSGLCGDLNIPNSVTSIGEFAFNECSGFDGHLTLSNSVTTIENYAFTGCSGFSGDLNIPNSVTSIGQYAFNECSGFNGHLTLSNSVTTIEYSAFSGCSGFSGDLNIPSSVTSIEGFAFYECSGFNGRLSLGNALAKIGKGAFMYCSGLNGELVIPNSVTTMGSFAFAGCTGFTGNLAIPNSLTEIYEGSFSNYGGGPMGFDGNLIIPGSIRQIYDQAFCNCNNLQSITIYCETPPEVIKIWLDEEEDAFYGINKEIPVNVPCGSVSEYASADYWNQFNNFQEFLPYSMTIEAYEPEKCSVSILQQPSCELQAIVKAEPAVGFVFEAWEENGMVVSNDITYAFTVDRDMHLYAKVKPGTGVSEILGEMVSVYPNPTDGQMKIEAEGIKHVTISNALGQVVYEDKTEGDAFEYDFNKHGAGVYLVRIETANGVAMKKVTVTR